MFKIVEKRKLAENIYLMRIAAERVARAALPGQFVIVRATENGERIPLTIADYDTEAGTVTIVTQTIGMSTRKICALNEGDSLVDFAGPLGRPSEFIHLSQEELQGRKYLFVAGGVGTAPVYPQVKWLHEHGVQCDVIIGSKTKDMLIYIEEMKKIANVHIATDDGTEGFKGMVTGLMKELVEVEGNKYDECICIGPMIMMKFVCLTTKPWDLKTTVSVGGKTLFTCVDGPEFDGHLVDFDEAIRRQGMYRNQERTAAENHEHKCKCHGE